MPHLPFLGLNSNHMVDFSTFINCFPDKQIMLSPEFKLLSVFLQNPSKELYGRQIERLATVSHERAVTYLNKLVNEHRALTKEKKGKQVFYRLNRHNELVLKTLSIAELERKIEFARKNEAGFVIQDLVSGITSESGSSIYFILLFGSTARGHAKEESDIDLLFVLLQNGKTKAKIEEMIKKRTVITGKRFSFHPVTLSELEKLWLKEPVYRNIWDERIVFFGEENFWKFVLKEGEPHG
jgi:predicted nucleotidyltransferase